MLERVQSPVVYREEKQIASLLREYSEKCFIPRATMHHYLGMAKNTFADIKGKDKVKLKKLFYARRATLASKWILEKDAIPPIVFMSMVNELSFDKALKNRIEYLIQLKSGEKGIEPIAIMSFNKDGYSKYCKDYKEYWDWVDKRNDVRYENTIEHGKNYDAKNMMHTFRSLNMAEEIASEGRVNVRRHDRNLLLRIRSGVFSYEELVDLANEKIHRIDDLYDSCSLPEEPDLSAIETLLAELREELYR